MKKLLFATDLDGTIIHSGMHDQSDRCVAVKNGKPASFMTETDYCLLKKILSCMDVLPVTTRCRRSYENILIRNLFARALVDNGAVLVSGDQREEERWLAESRMIVGKDREVFERAREVLERHGYREKWGSEFVLDYVHDNVTEKMQEEIHREITSFSGNILMVNISGKHSSAICTYRKLSKGACIRRFSGRFGYDLYLSAGDGAEDQSMFKESGYSIGPAGSGASCEISGCSADFHKSVIRTACGIVQNLMPCGDA